MRLALERECAAEQGVQGHEGHECEAAGPQDPEQLLAGRHPFAAFDKVVKGTKTHDRIKGRGRKSVEIGCVGFHHLLNTALHPGGGYLRTSDIEEGGRKVRKNDLVTVARQPDCVPSRSSTN